MSPIKQKRLACGFTTDDMLAALKVKRARYSSYEIGTRTPPPELIKPFAKKLGITTDELVSLIAETQRQRESETTATASAGK